MPTLTNRVTLMGHLGSKPKVFQVPGKSLGVKLSLATHEIWEKEDTNQSHTDWHTIVAYGKYYVELAQKQFKVGDKLLIEGKLRTRKWTTQQGEKRLSVFVEARQILPISIRPSDVSVKPNEFAESGEYLSSLDEYLPDLAMSDETIAKDKQLVDEINQAAW